MATDHGGVVNELVAGTWRHPRTGEPVRIPIGQVVIRDTIDGAEADLVRSLHPDGRLVLVADPITHDVLGARVGAALARAGLDVRQLVWTEPGTTQAAVQALRGSTQDADHVIAVGGGTINDAVKYATYLDGKPFSVFPTSPMNAFTTGTASITVEGVKRSLKAHNPEGVFFGLDVLARCPPRLVRSAFADVICRTTAQVDWLLSHRLFGTPYLDTPFLLLAYDEDALLDGAGAIAAGDPEAFALLTRISAIMGLGTSFAGSTHSGSMAEHMVSHCLDMFAGAAHPGSTHGEQVGVATLTISGLQNAILREDRPPELRPTSIPRAELATRWRAPVADAMLEQAGAKFLDAAAADRLNALLDDRWPALRAELSAVMLPTERLARAMHEVDAPTTAAELGFPADLYRDALRDARFTRDRFTILDLAADGGLLEGFVPRLD